MYLDLFAILDDVAPKMDPGDMTELVTIAEVGDEEKAKAPVVEE